VTEERNIKKIKKIGGEEPKYDKNEL